MKGRYTWNKIIRTNIDRVLCMKHIACISSGSRDIYYDFHLAASRLMLSDACLFDKKNSVIQKAFFLCNFYIILKIK